MKLSVWNNKMWMKTANSHKTMKNILINLISIILKISKSKIIHILLIIITN